MGRWNGLSSLKFKPNGPEWTRNLTIYVYNQPYSHPSNGDKSLHEVAPPIIERFELTAANVDKYFIEENNECIVIDFALTDELLQFDQYSFVATDIESDKEKLVRNVDFGNDKTEWINPNLHKIRCNESAILLPHEFNE